MIKFPFAVLLGIWSLLFWRTPTTEDVVKYIEGTSIVTVLRRDWPAKHPPAPSTAGNNVRQRSCEERHYSVDVENCLLEHVSRERGGTIDEGVVTPITSWRMSYTRPEGAAGTRSGKTGSTPLSSTGRR